MAMLQDGLLAFFSAVGLTTVVWLVGGSLFHSGRKYLADREKQAELISAKEFHVH